MLRVATWFLILTGCAVGGVVSGVILDYGSGRPLVRTTVTLEPLPGASGLRTMTVRSGRSGHLTFDGIAPGMYRVHAQRRGFVTTFYGQRRPEGQGTPVQVTADSSLFAEIRLRRMGAVTGSVLDENGIGIAGGRVIAYHARLPLRSAGSGIADDRGVYRIGGLRSGKYWVRSAAHTLEDGSGRIPTFGPQTQVVRDGRVHQVGYDAEAIAADVYPQEGFVVLGRWRNHLPPAGCASGCGRNLVGNRQGRRSRAPARADISFRDSRRANTRPSRHTGTSPAQRLPSSRCNAICRCR